MRPISKRLAGFTLIEMIVVMTITSILLAAVAIFIRRPMEGIIDTTRRAALADSADTALRRMRRDVQRSLPNSVRFTSSGANRIVEFLPTVSGGRYCSETGTSPACTVLDFSTASSSFSYLGTLPGFAAAEVAEVAVYNLGIPGADAYSGGNTSAFGSVTGSTITMTAKQFPFPSPGNRFHLIGKPVSFVCAPASSGNEGTGTLHRVSGYAKQATQSATPAALAGASSNLLAANVASCNVDYVQSTIDQNGLLSIQLQLQKNGETVTLTHEIQINNVP